MVDPGSVPEWSNGPVSPEGCADFPTVESEAPCQIFGSFPPHQAGQQDFSDLTRQLLAICMAQEMLKKTEHDSEECVKRGCCWDLDNHPQVR